MALFGLAGLGAGFFARSEYEKKHFVTETFETDVRKAEKAGEKLCVSL